MKRVTTTIARRLPVLSTLVAALLLAVAFQAPALATFLGTTTGTAAVSSATLNPPASATLTTTGCGWIFHEWSGTVTWPKVDKADSYVVILSVDGTARAPITVNANTSSYSFSVSSLSLFSRTYKVTVQSRLKLWSSAVRTSNQVTC